jgi:hypothetical protein
MTEMIEIKKKPEELVWEVDHRFKILKGKLKYPITDMQHRHLFVNSLLAHLKYPLRKKKFQTWVEELQETLHLEENQYKHTYPIVEEMRQDMKNLTFQLNHNKGKEKRENVGCTLCKTEVHHTNECPLFA